MRRSSMQKAGVVLLDTRKRTPEHEHATHLKLGHYLAGLLGTEMVDPGEQPAHGADIYYLPTTTLIDPARYTPLGIFSEADLFGGLVSHPYMATKAISHPRLADATFPPGWTDDFACRAGGALLRGHTVFSKVDARRAARLLLLDGPVRVKPVLACAGRGQHVIQQSEELEPLLAEMEDATLEVCGLVLEENLTQVETFSVGQARVAG